MQDVISMKNGGKVVFIIMFCFVFSRKKVQMLEFGLNEIVAITNNIKTIPLLRADIRKRFTWIIGVRGHIGITREPLKPVTVDPMHRGYLGLLKTLTFY